MRIQIIETSADGMRDEVWSFVVIFDWSKAVIRLSMHEQRERPSKRHKFKCVRSWADFTHDRRGYSAKQTLDRTEPPLSIKERVWNEIRNQVEFT